MRPVRRLLALLLVIALAGCNAPEETPPTPEPEGPPPPPPPPTAGSFDLSQGDSWRHEGDNVTTTSRILSVANGTLTMLATTERPGEAPQNVTTRFNESTMAIVAVIDEARGVEMRFEPPLSILVPAADHEYDGNITVRTFIGDLRQPANGTVRFLGLENVSVPAGDFHAYRYEATFQSDGAFPFRQTREIWYAPAVQQAVRSTIDGRTEELVAYDVAAAE